MSTKKRRRKGRPHDHNSRDGWDMVKRSYERGWDRGYSQGLRDGNAFHGVNARFYYWEGMVVVPGLKAQLSRAARAMNAQIRAAHRAVSDGANGVYLWEKEGPIVFAHKGACDRKLDGGRHLLSGELRDLPIYLANNIGIRTDADFAEARSHAALLANL